MTYKIIPLTTSPNQKLSITLPINGQNITLNLSVRYNTVANYWVMTVADKSGNVLIDSLPVITGEYPAANILGQYQYLGIGSAVVVNASNTELDIPSDKSLGVDHYLVRYRDWETDRKSTRLNSSHSGESRMPSSA